MVDKVFSLYQRKQKQEVLTYTILLNYEQNMVGGIGAWKMNSVGLRKLQIKQGGKGWVRLS